MDVIELVGRVLFALTFIISPAAVFDQAPRIAGSPMMKAYPTAFAVVAVRVSCVFSMLGGALIAVGLWPDAGAVLVLAFLVPVTLTMHRFWEVEPGLPRKQKRDVFLTNVALAGACLVFFAFYNQGQDVGLGLTSGPLFGRI